MAAKFRKPNYLENARGKLAGAASAFGRRIYVIYVCFYSLCTGFFLKFFCRAGRNVSVCLISMHFTDGGTELARQGCFFFEKMKVFALASDGCVKAFPTLSTSHLS